MKTYKFKTNINCGKCLAAVTPVLNAEPRIKAWEVDLNSEDRILTVDTPDMNPEDIYNAVKKAGFIAKAE